MSQKQPSSSSSSSGGGGASSSKNPHGDVSFIRATPTGPFSPLSPSPIRERSSSSGGGGGNPYPHPAVPPSGVSPRLPEAAAMGGVGMGVGVGGWNEREENLTRELEEAKVRIAQMEKTMRWWSDCTANWRDKWTKARNERNKARDENRQLRSRLDVSVKECTTLKRRLRGGGGPGGPGEADDPSLKSPAPVTDQASEDGGSSKRDSVKTISCKDSSSSSDVSVSSAVLKSEKEKQERDGDEKDTDETETLSVGGLETQSLEACLAASPLSVAGRLEGVGGLGEGGRDENANARSSAGGAVSPQHMTQLQQQLEAANKTIQTQTYERDTLSRTIDTLETELSSLRVKCDEIKQTRQDLSTQSAEEDPAEGEVGKMREDHQMELSRLTLDLEDESSKSTSMDRRLTELRRELERLQSENAAEWQKRERLESEKQLLERENRKLRTQVSELDEQLQRKHQQAAASVDGDLRTLQFDLAEKNKELTELRYSHSKVRKTLTERVTELEHTKRRADQYEAEVKRLRGRVEELKRDLAGAEDQVDMQVNSARRVQRSNDELQEQVDNLTLQVDHLQNRLRRGSQTLPKTRSSSLKSFNMEDSAELADSEDDDLDDT